MENPNSADAGFKFSHHREGLEYLTKTLKELDIPYTEKDENDVRGDPEFKPQSIKNRLVLVPEMRTCKGETYETLKIFAENGGIVFAYLDSFYHQFRENRSPERIIQKRIQDLFALPETSFANSEEFVKGEIRFTKSSYEWLTSEISPSFILPDQRFLGVIGTSTFLKYHGEIVADVKKKVKDTSGKEIEEIRKNKSYPAFIIREYPSGGLFIYACFNLRRITNAKGIYKNLFRYQGRGATDRQISYLKWAVIVLTAIISLFIAREFINIGTPWLKEIGSSLLGGFLGWIIGQILDKVAERTSSI